MLFVWSIEAVLLSLIAVSLNAYADSFSYNLYMGQLFLTLLALVSLVAVSALSVDLYHLVACAYLSALISLYVTYVPVPPSWTDMYFVISMAFDAVMVFNGIAMVFASTAGPTPLMFHRTYFMFIALGLWFRISSTLWINMLIASSFAVGNVVCMVLGRTVSNIFNVLTAGGFLVYLFLYTPPPLNWAYIGMAVFFTTVAVLWIFADLPPPAGPSPSPDNNHVIVDTTGRQFDWPSNVQATDLKWQHVKFQ